MRMLLVKQESAKESMTYIKVSGLETDAGLGTFRLSTNVLYEYSLAELEDGQSDPSKTCILRLEKKNGALSDTLHQIYTNQMECFQRQICSESLSFTQCKNLDSFFKTLASLFTDCKDFDLKVDMSRQILKTTLLLDVFKDWVSDDAAKTKPLSLQFRALGCVHLMFQEMEGRMMILEQDMAVNRLTAKLARVLKKLSRAILHLTAAARSGAISEQCVKILIKLGQTVPVRAQCLYPCAVHRLRCHESTDTWTRGDQANHGFQGVNKQNPVLEAVSAVFHRQSARAFPCCFV